MPMKTMSGFDSETATAPTDALVIWPSVIGVQRLAAVGRLPQSAARGAEVADLRLALHAADRDRRPPRSGPTLRQRSALATTLSMTGGAFVEEMDSAPRLRPTTPTIPVNAMETAMPTRANSRDIEVLLQCRLVGRPNLAWLSGRSLRCGGFRTSRWNDAGVRVVNSRNGTDFHV